nr:MAG: hypothetical protein DiTV3a_F2ORF22 [Diabrotica toursvirus 3a]
MSTKKKFTPLDTFIIKNTPCKNGRFCTVENCQFIHELKTKMCKYAEKCKNRQKCTFAHLPSELYIPDCRFGSKCNKKDVCKFKHPIMLIIPNSPPKESVPESEDFPVFQTDISIEEKNDILNYTEMRQIIKYSSFSDLHGNTEELIGQYKNILDFKKIIFNISK